MPVVDNVMYVKDIIDGHSGTVWHFKSDITDNDITDNDITDNDITDNDITDNDITKMTSDDIMMTS